MSNEVIIANMEPQIKPLFVECKFTVECNEGQGGDFEKNIGGVQRRTRISFDGYATDELYRAVMDAVGKVVE